MRFPVVPPVVGALALAGLALGMIEQVLVLALDAKLFLSLTEVSRFALSGPSAMGALCVVVGLGWLLIERGMAHVVGDRWGLRGALVALLAWPSLWWVLWELTSGRRLRDLPARAVWVPGGACISAMALGGAYALARRAALRASARVWLSRALWVLAAVAVVVDGLVLRRLYPALHGFLAVTAVVTSIAAGLSRPVTAQLAEGARTPAVRVAVSLSLLGPLLLFSLRDAPNIRFAVVQAAPLSGKLLSLIPQPRRRGFERTDKRAAADASAASSLAAKRDGQQSGLDLRGRDLLLLSVDALRVDRLLAYGGSGLTPNMDALARTGVLFARAYTTTPHTSYAVASLMTGKYMRAVMELAGKGGQHVTLADVLRRYGYRTAGFYPPAVFHVDGARFEDFAHRQLGFEYAKVMYADGADRVAQLERYLREDGAGHPVFAWVHLFEPHEPYRPRPAFARGARLEQRYDGEVAQADAAVGELVALFRRLRPHSIIVLTADHGEEFDDHGGYYHGTTLFDEQIRVPLLFVADGALAPRVVKTPVDLVDVVTTVLSAFGMPRDVRMYGDDLSPLLAGGVPESTRYAYSAIERERMVTDGRFKAICADAGRCRLYDLGQDPQERRDIADIDPGTLARLSERLSAFVASVPQMEAMSLPEGSGIPRALARAELGDGTAGGELVPLLAAPAASVRARAARACGRLMQRGALSVLSRLSEADPDRTVRAEAAVARLRLGDMSAQAQVRALLPDPELEASVVRGAALSLAQAADREGLSVLIAAARDRRLEESERLAAIFAIGDLSVPEAVPTLSELFGEVRLRGPVATALGRIGTPAAIEALLSALASERYPEARRAEAQALTDLGVRRAAGLIATHLGTDGGLDGGVSMLRKLGALAPGGQNGRVLPLTAAARVGPWQCEDSGCWPAVSAGLRLPRSPRADSDVQLALRVTASAASGALRSRGLTVAGRRISLAAGAQEIRLRLSGPGRVIPVEADPGVMLEAFVLVPAYHDPTDG